jgi:hypothetical protein
MGQKAAGRKKRGAKDLRLEALEQEYWLVGALFSRPQQPFNAGRS